MQANEAPGSAKHSADRERLWKVASGKAVRWREMTVLILGALQFLLGLVSLLVLGASATPILSLASGVFFVAVAILLILNARIDAVWELVRSGKP